MKVKIYIGEESYDCLCDSYEFNEGLFAIIGLRVAEDDEMLGTMEEFLGNDSKGINSIQKIDGIIFDHDSYSVCFAVKYKGMLDINETMEIIGYEFTYDCRIKRSN